MIKSLLKSFSGKKDLASSKVHEAELNTDEPH